MARFEIVVSFSNLQKEVFLNHFQKKSKRKKTKTLFNLVFFLLRNFIHILLFFLTTFFHDEKNNK